MKSYLRLLLLLICISPYVSYAQNRLIKGTVKSTTNEAISHVTISESNHDNHVISDENGQFEIKVRANSQSLLFTSIGYKKNEVSIQSLLQQGATCQVTLESESVELESVVVSAKTYADEIKGFGYNVSAINVKPFHNASVNLSDVLNKTPGVKIREEGGHGSRTNVTINGLSGKHVRFLLTECLWMRCLRPFKSIIYPLIW